MNQVIAHLRTDGRWEAKGVDATSGRRKSFYSRSGKEEAERLARESYGIQLDDSFYAYYVATYIPTVVTRSRNWRDQIKWAMDKHWLPYFGTTPIQDIQRRDVQIHFNKLAKKLGPKSIRHVYKVVSSVFALAEVDEVIVRTPFLKIRLPEMVESTRVALTFEQLAALIKHAHPLIKPMVLLGGCCGLRPGECLGVQRNRIDKDGVLEVCQQILQHDGDTQITQVLKTPQSHRWIPLPDSLRDMIINCDQVSDVWICSNGKGGYLWPRNTARELKRACIAAGVMDGDKPLISPNELRHTFISLMENDMEAPPRIVEQIVGKKKKGRTGTYSHTELRQMKKWMDLFMDRVSTELTTTAVVKMG